MRPTDLTPEMHDKLVKLIEDGMPLSKAAAHEGIHWATFKRWRTRKGDPYEEFCASIKRAQAVAQKQMIQDIRDGVENWQARAWYLERSDPKNWGRKDKLDTTVRKEPDDIAKMSAAEKRDAHLKAAAELEQDMAEGKDGMH